jgi:Spy/CpxP family protein refolding chaperone
MRKTVMTLVLVGLLALPVLAQRQRGGRGGFGQFGGEGALLMNKSVQEELKLTDKQKEEVKAISTKAQGMMKEAMEARQDGDQEKARELMTKSMEARTAGIKKLKDSLTSVQKKRLGEIEIQQAVKNKTATVFTREDVQAALKLTPKQKTTIKETLSDYEKDRKELMGNAGGGGRGGFNRENMKKLQELNKDTYEKISKSLTEEQTKTFSTLGGEKFELKNERPMGGRGGRGGDRKKKDDF